MGHVLVLGGARSGKTAFAERRTLQLGQSPVYLATAEARDAEMRDRVAAHREQRAGRFLTIEEPLDLSGAIREAAAAHDAILVDCLTLWITNMIIADKNVADAVDELIETLGATPNVPVVLVSNEVGLGIVPDNAMARLFRDLAGSAHQRIAAVCDEAYFVVAGLPLTLKGAPGLN